MYPAFLLGSEMLQVIYKVLVNEDITVQQNSFILRWKMVYALHCFTFKRKVWYPSTAYAWPLGP